MKKWSVDIWNNVFKWNNYKFWNWVLKLDNLTQETTVELMVYRQPKSDSKAHPQIQFSHEGTFSVTILPLVTRIKYVTIQNSEEMITSYLI